jgi:hypothetical protein
VVGRPPQTISVMTNAVRLTKKFAQMDGYQWREYQENTVIRDPQTIEYLIRIGAPVERIEIDQKLSPPPKS